MSNTKAFPYEPQGALQFNEKHIQEAIDTSGLVYCGIKVDGVRGIIQVHPDGSLTVSSRSSKPLAALETLGDGLQEALKGAFPEGLLLDCELTVKGRSFQKGCGDLRRKKPLDKGLLTIWPITMALYDQARLGERSLAPFVTRRNGAQMSADLLGDILGVTVQDLRLPSALSLEQVHALYEHQRQQGFEGLIVYGPSAEDRPGKVKGWWKVKPENEIDGVVINWVASKEGQFAGMMGALTVQCEDGTITDVGTGFTPEDRAKGRDYWIGMQVQLTFMERTDDGRLRHPAFDRERGTEADPTVKS